jgi:hypothetical protein
MVGAFTQALLSQPALPPIPTGRASELRVLSSRSGPGRRLQSFNRLRAVGSPQLCPLSAVSVPEGRRAQRQQKEKQASDRLRPEECSPEFNSRREMLTAMSRE